MIAPAAITPIRISSDKQKAIEAAKQELEAAQEEARKAGLQQKDQQ